MVTALRRSCPLVAAALLLVTGRGAAQDPDPSQYWLVPYVQQGWLTPSLVEAGQPFTLTLVGTFPYDCGVIADTNVVGTRIEFTMRPGIACGDTARGWRHVFPLGPLATGVHTITLSRRLVRAGGAVDLREASFEIGVGIHPPPPPTCPLYSHFTTSPAVPNDDEPTTVTLHGCWPGGWDCGEIARSRKLGPTELEVVMRRIASCADTSGWTRDFDVGTLAAGDHNLIVRVIDEANPLVAEVFGQWLHVEGDSAPPPPPPPPPITTGPLFRWAGPSPWPPNTSEPTQLIVSGTYQYECGFISDFQVLSPSHVAMTVRRGRAGCAAGDSVRFFSQPFGLGLLAAGHYDVRIDIRDAGSADSLTVHTFAGAFDVTETGPPPPPPPPPVDSLSASRPNPFDQETRFALTLDEPAPVEVVICDLQGRLVRVVFRGTMSAGSRDFVWDGRREDGSAARAGVYFYRVIRPGRAISRRVVYLPRP